MLLTILAILAILGSVIGVYGLLFVRRNAQEAKDWVTESYTQWREDGLDVDGYDIVVHDTQLRDVFDAFPRVSEAYISPEDVEQRFSMVRESEREITAQVKRSTDKIRARVESFTPAKKNGEENAEEAAAAVDTPAEQSAEKAEAKESTEKKTAQESEPAKDSTEQEKPGHWEFSQTVQFPDRKTA